MTTLHLRILAVSLFLMFAYILFEVHFVTMDIPDMAAAYIQWWRAQPLNPLQVFVLQYGTLTHTVLLLSLLGVALLWSPARYVFTVTMFFMAISEALFSVPLVVIGRLVMLENVAAIMAGMLIYAMFFTPLRHEFAINPFGNRARVAR
jgi:hypothetical protein